jgi:MFS family permease
MQPYLLELYGDEDAYAIAGLAAAIIAGAQIVGGLLVPQIRRLFGRRTSVLLAATTASAALLLAIGLVAEFWAAIALLVFWALMFAAVTPVRQAYLNGLIPSTQRATVLSFDSLLGSTGAVAIQPALGKAADAWSYGTSYACGAAIQAMALPFIWLARRERAAADPIVRGVVEEETTAIPKASST